MFEALSARIEELLISLKPSAEDGIIPKVPNRIFKLKKNVICMIGSRSIHGIEEAKKVLKQYLDAKIDPIRFEFFHQHLKTAKLK